MPNIASVLKDEIVRLTRKEFRQQIEPLKKQILTQRNRSRIGDTVEVLVDTLQKGRWTGRTRGNLLVHIDSTANLLGKLVPARITDTSPWYLIGTVDGPPV